MSFDFSKTATFFPFVWMTAKCFYVLALFGLFSSDTVDWSNARAPSSDQLQLTTNAFDRFLMGLMIHFVLLECQLDRLITRSEELNSKPTTNFSCNDIRIGVDIFFAACLVIFAKKNPLVIPITALDQYTFNILEIVWVVSAFVVLACDVSHLYRPDAFVEHGFVHRFKTSQNHATLFTITILASTLTSPCVHSILHDMDFYSFVVRVLVYVCFVGFRFYVAGVLCQTLLASPMPTRLVLGWIMLVPLVGVYIALLLPLGLHFSFISSNTRKKPLLPLQLPTNPTHADSLPIPIDFADNSDIVTKLKMLERQQAIEPHNGTSAKRRLTALF